MSFPDPEIIIKQLQVLLKQVRAENEALKKELATLKAAKPIVTSPQETPKETPQEVTSEPTPIKTKSKKKSRE